MKIMEPFSFRYCFCKKRNRIPPALLFIYLFISREIQDFVTFIQVFDLISSVLYQGI